MQLSSSLALLVSLVAVGATYGRYARDVYARDLYARHYDYDSLYAREADASDLYARGYDPLYARDVYERNAYDDDELYARDTWEGLETRDADADASLLNLIPLPIQKGTCQRGSLYAPSLRCIDSNGHGVVTKTACTSVGAPCDARH